MSGCNSQKTDLIDTNLCADLLSMAVATLSHVSSDLVGVVVPAVPQPFSRPVVWEKLKKSNSKTSCNVHWLISWIPSKRVLTKEYLNPILEHGLLEPSSTAQISEYFFAKADGTDRRRSKLWFQVPCEVCFYVTCLLS